MVKIGDIELRDKALFLAPMEDVTDPSFRFMCKQYGADMMYTEFIASEALIRDIEKSKRKLTVYDYERPIGIQLYGHNTDAMVESAKMAEAAGPNLIDINCGCPVKKIAMRGAGSGLLQDIPKLVQMVDAIVKSVNLPVTLKTRLGWDDQSKFIVDIAERLQDVGIQALTIHGRTRAQLYNGDADWTLIGAVKNNPRMKIPIIGNGDVNSPQKAKLMFDTYGVDGVMIGRATYGRPWIFKEIHHFIDTGEELAPIGLKEKVEMAKLQLKKSIEWKGDRAGIFEMRRHLTTYFKALPNFKEMRLKLVTANEYEEVVSLIDQIYEMYKDVELHWTVNENLQKMTEN
jgi:nifR3 family TIM-barrel protein